MLAQGLLDLGILSGTLEDALQKPEVVDGEATKESLIASFICTKPGIGWGWILHDVGDYKIGDAWRTLEPGMVLTVEPGLYISPAR